MFHITEATQPKPIGTKKIWKTQEEISKQFIADKLQTLDTYKKLACSSTKDNK